MSLTPAKTFLAVCVGVLVGVRQAKQRAARKDKPANDFGEPAGLTLAHRLGELLEGVQDQEFPASGSLLDHFFDRRRQQSGLETLIALGNDMHAILVEDTNLVGDALGRVIGIDIEDVAALYAFGLNRLYQHGQSYKGLTRIGRRAEHGPLPG